MLLTMFTNDSSIVELDSEILRMIFENINLNKVSMINRILELIVFTNDILRWIVNYEENLKLLTNLELLFESNRFNANILRTCVELNNIKAMEYVIQSLHTRDKSFLFMNEIIVHQVKHFNNNKECNIICV